MAARAQALAGLARGSPLQNSGIAGTPIVASFSLAMTGWLVRRFGRAVSLAGIEGDPSHVMAVLDPALDPLEREVLTEQPLGWTAWQRQHLGREREARLRRLVALAEQLPGPTAAREATFAALRVFVRWETTPEAPVLTLGRYPGGPPTLRRRGRRRSIRLADAWREGRPRRMPLAAAQRDALVDLARGSLASQLAETEPFTYAARGEVELHRLGHGIQVALYPMTADQKLPLEAYIGYLLLKNGVPVAYGGGWVLGRQARFGINVLPPFRGGESAILLGQLLRLYGWRFGLKRFLVEPFQIGRGNPDGIASGAFWFYWRLGFRPMQPALRARAAAEARRVQTRGTRTPAAVLRELAGSTMAWQTPLTASWPALDIEQIGAAVSRHVLDKFDGDRGAAQRSAMRSLGFREPRLAVLLAAIAPRGGWPAGQLARLAAMMADKNRGEMRQVTTLQTHRGLMSALARVAAMDRPARGAGA